MLLDCLFKPFSTLLTLLRLNSDFNYFKLRLYKH